MKRMANLWQELKGKGAFTLVPEEFQRVVESGFVAGSSTHAERVATICSIYEKYGVLIDPHTADGVTTGLKHHKKDISLICLETAQPAKFAAAIHEAIGREPGLPESFKKLADLPERSEVFDADAERVKEFIAEHV